MRSPVLVRLFIIASESEHVRKLSSELAQMGFSCLIAPYSDKTINELIGQSPDLAFLNMDESAIALEAWELSQRIKQELYLPIIALVSREKLDSLDSSISIDDFVVKPWEATEVAARIKRTLMRKGSIDSREIIKCGDLIIDIAKCEVSLSGKPIVLTFKEYQLLKFLTSNQGRVFTREDLLDKVWGWDYYGGDRTVDVHVRRLRSKIEDRNHSFIETIRNIGYKFMEM